QGLGAFEVMVPLAGPANSLEITDAAGTTMFGGFVRSATPPAVRVSSPQKGATIDAPMMIKWDVSDPDSTPAELMFQAAYSPDGGKSFVPIGVNLTTNELDFDPGSVEGSDGGGLIRIFASDGLNTSFFDVAGLSVRAPMGRQICIGSTFGEPGQRVTVPISLDNGEGVAGFQVDVGFNPSLLNPAGVRLGADTAAATGWSINSALVGFGVLRVLGHSNPPAGLGPGPAQVALVDFDIAASAPIGPMSPFGLGNCVLSDANGVQIPCNSCPQPGQVIVRPAGSFNFRPIGSPVGVDQFDPLPFPATVEALTFTGTLATGYNGTAAMSVGPVCAGTLQPASLGFSSGIGSAPFRIACCLDPLLPMTRTSLNLQATDPGINITGSSAPFNGVAKADVNADDAVNVLDVVRAINFSLNLPVGAPPPLPFQRWAANMLDQRCVVDALINVLDVVRIRNKALGRPPLCPCSAGGVGALSAQAAVLAAPPTPFSISVEKDGPKEFLVKVRGAVDLSGLQLELKAAGAKATVSLEGLTAGKNWQATTTLDQGVLRIVAFSNAATGVSGDGAVLRIKGGGSPRLTAIVASDSEGREIAALAAK
ncbi:MAG TPA: cohesin domain-containing protein, partial [Candidatus Eisenbacteria bacterium]|nr:cohesin domain-containing protein [Candidatus Eisenbacteria bacterium]